MFFLLCMPFMSTHRVWQTLSLQTAAILAGSPDAELRFQSEGRTVFETRALLSKLFVL